VKEADTSDLNPKLLLWFSINKDTKHLVVTHRNAIKSMNKKVLKLLLDMLGYAWYISYC